MTVEDATTEDQEASTPRLNFLVPVSVEDMKPAKASSLITEAAAFLRVPEYYDVAKPYLQAISGEVPSIHGSVTLDEAAYTFKVQEIAKQNGFAFLGTVSANKLRRALRFAYKRNTGVSVRLLEKQRKQLQLTHLRTF